MSTPRLMDQVHQALRVHHYSLRTEQAYIHWIRRFIFFHNKRHPREMGADEIASFLSHLAVDKHVSASTQNQALSALLFLYKKVLNIEPEWIEDVVRAKRPKRLPVVLSRETVTQLLSQIDDPYRLICWLMYGTGLRLYEALTLRVKDIDFDQDQIIVRAGKGNKDRVTVLPERLVEPLQQQLQKSRVYYEQDRRDAAPGVYLPYALERKYPRAGTEWPWQWVFPANHHSKDPRSGIVRRHHIYEKGISRAMKKAANYLNLPTKISSHTLRHCFATHLLEDGYDIRTVQELMGHKDVKTTMIYTHVMKKGAMGVRSPLDRITLKKNLP